MTEYTTEPSEPKQISPSAPRTPDVPFWYRWIDASGAEADVTEPDAAVDWPRVVPYIGLHLGCLGVFWFGVSSIAVITAVLLYLVRMFAITGFYHRYFSHRSFRTSRPFQFVMAMLGASAVQRGPIWWAAHHRHHHLHSDEDHDWHSPRVHGFWFSHMGWFLTKGGFKTQIQYVRDWLKFPELRLLDRYDWIVPVLLGVAMYGWGSGLAWYAPQLGTSGWQMVVWGFFISTIAVYHATYAINSLAHTFGSQRYDTGDDSRNSLLLALLTLGEGWHNNHHRYPQAVRQGFFWWEVDVTFYILVLFSKLGLIWGLRTVPPKVLNEAGPPLASSGKDDWKTE